MDKCITKTCLVCGKEFSDSSCHIKKRKTCSYPCARKLQYPPRPAVYDSETKAFIIPLTRGYSAAVDPEDADVGDVKWKALVAPHTDIVYAVRSGDVAESGEPTRMHRVVMERIMGHPLDPTDEVDHKDGNGLNNRRNNLRKVTKEQNRANTRMHVDNATGHKGITWDKSRNKWLAQLTANHKRVLMRRFDTLEEALSAYQEAVAKHQGEFAPKRTR